MNVRAAARQRTPEQIVSDLRWHARTACAGFGAGSANHDYEAARAFLEPLSAQLQAASEDLGFDNDLAWSILGVREHLDSHLVAASAVSGAELDPTAALDLLRRGLDGVVERLPGPDETTPLL